MTLAYIAATFPFVFKDPDASPVLPRGPRARLILPPNVNEPAAMNDLCSTDQCYVLNKLGQNRLLSPVIRKVNMSRCTI